MLQKIIFCLDVIFGAFLRLIDGIIHKMNTMKPTKLFLALAVAVLLGACGNNTENVADATTYEVKGSVKNMQDGIILMLFSYKDGGGSMIAMDTVQAGSFYFKVSPETDNTERYMIAGVRNPDFSPLGLHFWAAAGDRVRIKGNNNLIFTWEVIELA